MAGTAMPRLTAGRLLIVSSQRRNAGLLPMRSSDRARFPGHRHGAHSARAATCTPRSGRDARSWELV